MQRQIKRGAAAGAGLIFHVFAQDSASTTGAGKASVAFGSWTCRYIRNGEAISGAITPEDITTIGTYAAPTANTNIRIKAVDNTNMIGVYEVQIHADWVNTTNSCQSLTIYLTATGVAPLPIQIQLVAFDPQDTVRLGLTALPNAAAEAAGGLYTRGSGAGQINQNNNGQIDVSVKRWDGVALIAPDTPGAPKVTIIDGTGQGELLTGAGIVQADAAMIAGSAPSATNMVVVFGTDFASNYDTTADRWKASLTHMAGTVLGAQVSTNWLQFWQNDAVVSGMNMDQADAYAALAAFNLDHLVGTAAGIPAIPAGTYLDQIMDDGTAVYDRTTDSLQAQRDRTVSSHTAADVWAVATRLLTAGTNIVLAKGVGVTGFNDLDAAGVRAAVGLAAANLDTQFTNTVDGVLDAIRVSKNTALANFMFKMVLTSDHVSNGTGLTVTAQRSIDGGAFAACTNAPVEISAGWYRIDLSAADLNGDVIALKFTAATADQTDMLIVTQPKD